MMARIRVTSSSNVIASIRDDARSRTNAVAALKRMHRSSVDLRQADQVVANNRLVSHPGGVDAPQIDRTR